MSVSSYIFVSDDPNTESLARGLVMDRDDVDFKSSGFVTSRFPVGPMGDCNYWFKFECSFVTKTKIKKLVKKCSPNAKFKILKGDNFSWMK